MHVILEDNQTYKSVASDKKYIRHMYLEKFLFLFRS